MNKCVEDRQRTEPKIQDNRNNRNRYTYMRTRKKSSFFLTARTKKVGKKRKIILYVIQCICI